MPSLDRIEQHLQRLVHRERRLLALRAGLQLAGALAVSAVVPAALLSGGVRVPVALGVSTAVAAALCTVALGWPLLRRWGPSGSLLVQARRIEALVPALQQRLVTVVGRADRVRAGDAPLLLQAAARAETAALAVPPGQALPLRPLRPVAGGLGAAVLVFALAVGLLPVGPHHILGILQGGSVAEARLEELAETVGEDRVVVGDITLRYVFPDYIGADPVEVPNSDGTIHAPPGTRVEIRARTERPFDAAALQVDEGAPTDAVVFGGRDLSAALTVEQAGTWRFLLFSGEAAFQSADFRIEVEDDAAPVVAIERPPAARVPVDRPLPLSWSVQDDFGIQRVVLEVETPDGQVRELPLRTPLDPVRELRGNVPLSPRELGLAPGRSAKLRVVAYDNDVQGESKRGVSAEMEIEAVGPQGQAAQLRTHTRQLRDLLVVVLADFLEEDRPATASSPAMQAWVETARGRFDPVRDLQKAQWGDGAAASFDGQMVARVDEAAGRLFRFTMTTWEPGARRRITASDEDRFDALHGELVVAIEGAVYALDMLVRQAGMAELGEQAELLAREAGELAALAQDASPGELLARLDKLERMMGDLARAAEKLGEGGIQEFVNSRTEQTRNLMDEIRKAIAEGREDDARRMMEQMAEQVRQMSEGINDQMAAQQVGEDDLAEQMEQTMAELSSLEKDQRDLARELRDKADELGDGVSEQVQKWAEVDELVARLVQHAGDAVRGTGDGRGWRSSSIRVIEQARSEAERVRDATRARDVERALERVYEAQRPALRANRAVRMEQERARPSTQPLPDGIAGVDDDTRAAIRLLDELARKLEDLLESQQSSSPEVEQAARELSGAQSELSRRQEDLEKKVREVEQGMPLAEGKATEAMQKAGAAMERAEGALEQGDALGGQGHQEEAADRLREAQDQLQSAMQQQQQMQQAQQQLQGNQPPPQGSDQEGTQSSQPLSFELPPPEAFQTPEEYRRALLEGMAGEVPDEYRALNKRYFEELVRQ